jgi:flagellar biosynthetic protein FlhB
MADNRTEKGTPRRRESAREKGQVVRSRDFVSALTLFSVILFLAWRPTVWIGRWQTFFAHSLDASVRSDWSGQPAVIAWTGLAVAQWLLPIFAVALFTAAGSSLAQGGVFIAPGALAPDFNRLNPANNVKQLFSLSGFSRVFRSLLPSSVMVYLVIRLIVKNAPVVLHAARLNPRASLSLMGSMCFDLAWQSTFVFFAWSGVDYLLQRYTYEKSLRMTKQEVKQESKDSEGNPQVRGRLRRLRRELLRRSLQRDVQRATAVITNPTHYAIALEYRSQTMVAPVVVAKGRNLIALKIKELARWHEIPIVENPPLAQALYKAAEVGQMIPPQLYAAVAEILAFLYRAQMRMNSQPHTSQPGAAY